MKRGKGLAGLSRQHHGALVLAKHAQRTDTGNLGAAHQFMLHAVATFERDTAPHFLVEEEVLLPLLAAAGETDRVRRTLAEHEELRRLTDRLRERDVASLRRFGDALEAHVRFEERELFAVAEAALTPEQLAILENPDFGIGGGQTRPRPSHTTRHAGPHRAVREVEVMRDGARRVCRNRLWSAPV